MKKKLFVMLLWCEKGAWPLSLALCWHPGPLGIGNLSARALLKHNILSSCHRAWGPIISTKLFFVTDPDPCGKSAAAIEVVEEDWGFFYFKTSNDCRFTTQHDVTRFESALGRNSRGWTDKGGRALSVIILGRDDLS